MSRVFFFLSFLLFAFVPLKVFSCTTDSCNIIKALKLRYEKPDSSVLICNYLLNKSGVHDTITHRCYEVLGDVYWHKGDFGISLKNYHAAFSEAIKLKHPEKQSRALSNIGYVHMELGDYNAAVEALNGSAEIALKHDLKRRYQISMIYLAQVWGSNLQFEKAIAVQKQLLSKMDLSKDSISVAIVNGNMASNFKRASMDDSALKYYKIALVIDGKMGNEKELSNNYANVGEIYLNKGKCNEALEYLLKAVEINEKNGNKPGLAATTSILGRIYACTGDLANAKRCAEQAVSILPELESWRMSTYVYEQVSEVYKGLGDMNSAFKYVELYSDAKDSLFREENTAKMAQMQTRLEVSEKEKQIELLNMDKQLQERQRNLLLLVVLLVVIFAVFIFNRLKISRKQNKIIQAQKAEVEEAKHIVEMKQSEILDSIRYAKRIQSALVTSEYYINKELSRLNGKKL